MAASLISSVHNYPRTAPVNMSAAVAVNDIIVICASSNSGSHATATINAATCTVTMAEPTGGFIDNLNGTQLTILTGLVTAVASTAIPAITIANQSDIGFNAFAFRGLSSATPHKIGSTSASASPMTVALTSTVECLLVTAWASEDVDNFSSFNMSQTQFNHDSTHYDASGYHLSVAAGSVTPGVNVTGASTHMAVIALMLPVTAAAGIAARVYQRNQAVNRASTY